MILRDRVEWLLPEDLPEDSHGNTSYDWAAAATHVEPAFVGNVSSSENTTAQDQVSTSKLAILLPNTVGKSHARARWRGLEFEVDGDVMPVVDLRGRTHHCEALLRRVQG